MLSQVLFEHRVQTYFYMCVHLDLLDNWNGKFGGRRCRRTEKRNGKKKRRRESEKESDGEGEESIRQGGR